MLSRRTARALLVLLLTALAFAPSASALELPPGTPPTTSDDVPATYARPPLAVTLTADDPGPLASGVASTTYAIIAADGTVGPEQAYDAAAKPVLADGEALRYFSTDNDGNAETRHDSPVAHVDGAAPVTTDDVPSGFQRGPVPVTLDATDTGGSGLASTTYVIVAADGGVSGEQTYDPTAKPVLADGEAIRYASADAAGNAEAPHDSPVAHVDGSVPDTTITARPADVTRDTRPAVAFSSQAATDRFECSLDGGDFAACTSPYRPEQPLAGGDHTLRVRAVNRAGTVDPTPAAASFVVDTSTLAAPDPTPAPSPGTTTTTTAPDAASAAHAVLGPRSLTIATAGKIGIGCATDRGPLRACSARIVAADGTVLAAGAARLVSGQATSFRIVLLRTAAGRVALRRQPSGVPAFVDLLITTPDGRTLTDRSPTTLIASDRIVVLVNRTAALGHTARLEIAALARIYGNARKVLCTGYTDRQAHVSGKAAAARSRAQARSACALARRLAPHAQTTATGLGRRDPLATNTTAAGRAKNRRVVLTFG